MGQRSEDARTAGRGLVFIAGAKAYFIVTAYAVHLLLPRLFGSKEVYGLFSTALGLASILNNVLIAATVQTVSKFVSANEPGAPAALRQALVLQFLFGGVLSVLLIAAAPFIGTLEHDQAIVPLLRVTASVVFAYALYAALVGSLNGRRLFHVQAGLDATFSTLRTVGLLVGAAAGVGAIGALGGFSIAAAAILFVALLVVGLGRSGQAPPLRQWLGFMAPILLYQACLNGILLVDMQLLKSTAAELAMGAGMTAEQAAAVASGHVGIYSAAQKFALVPYQLMLSMTFVVFPMISRATSAGDLAATRATIRAAMRFSLIVLAAASAPIAGAANGVMRIAYPEEYLVGSNALAVLVVGAAAFALFVVTTTVLSGAGRPAVSMTIAAGALAVVVVANLVFVRSVGLGDDTAVATAAATSLGMLVALTAGGFVVHRLFGAFIAPITALRVLVAGAVAFGVARAIPHETRPMALVAILSAFAAYAVTLVVLREIGPRDRETLARILRRKSS